MGAVHVGITGETSAPSILCSRLRGWAAAGWEGEEGTGFQLLGPELGTGKRPQPKAMGRYPFAQSPGFGHQ